MKFKEYLQAKYASVINHLDLPCFIYEKQKIRYMNLTGKKLSFRHPIDINEKLLWLNRYWRDPIKTKCADKYLVREYIRDNGLENLLVPLIGVYSNTDEIVYDSLPAAFVLKCNHGSGYNLICTDKSKLDWGDAKRKLDQWMHSDYSRLFGEFHYSKIKRRIVCESLISDVAPIEYQCWCTNGKPDSFLICRKNFDGTYDAWSYSLDGKRLFERKDELPPPKQ